MVGNNTGRPPKRPRVDKCVDLAEHVELKQLKDENKQLREAMEELKGMVECPVCLKVPHQGGPLPVCSNGHFLCLSCRDRIRQEALEQEAKCPSCMVNLGNNTSLLASRLLEKVKHECKEEGCEEMIPFPDLEKHQKVCLFREVLCPGYSCKLKIALNKVEEHSRACADFNQTILNNNCERTLTMPQSDKGGDNLVLWPTKIMSAHGRKFFLRTKRENHYHSSEIVMLGSADKCKGFLASATVLDKDLKVFAKNIFRPRPISLEKWGKMGLVLPEDILSSIWTPDLSTPESPTFAYKIVFSVEKV